MPHSDDPHPSTKRKPGDIPAEHWDTDMPQRDFPEGQLPGLPVSRDPLLNPGPVPGPTEKPPLD